MKSFESVLTFLSVQLVSCVGSETEYSKDLKSLCLKFTRLTYCTYKECGRKAEAAVAGFVALYVTFGKY